MTVLFDVQMDVTNADNFDKDAALKAVTDENKRRAALDPPGAELPTSPNPVLFDSYKEVWDTQAAPNQHTGWGNAGNVTTDRQRRAAFHRAPDNVQDSIDAQLEPYM